MPRSRGTELPQRPAPRVPLKLKTTACTETNGVTNHRSMVDRSPKVHVDHRSPRSSSPLHEKKRGTRVADLESKLGKAQEELKKLKEQLASAEAAKKDAQRSLETAKKHVGRNEGVVTGEVTVIEESKNLDVESKDPELEIKESSEVIEPKVEVVESVNSVVTSMTDVFEVITPGEISVEKEENIDRIEGEEVQKEKENDEDEDAIKIIEEAVLIQEVKEKEISELDELKAKLTEREKEIEVISVEKTEMKRKAEEAMEQANKMEETMRVAVAAKEALEGEMRRLRIQTDQWRKAAEAAAAVLASGDCDMRCGSMEKGFIGSGGNGNGGFGYGWGSPGVGEEEEGKRRSGSGMRMFGELWKKRGQQK
ncbi:interactor of constitutive active ROPs 4-like [Carex rostrata]